MMMDNDFPTKLGGDKNTIGFLQQYVSGMQDYSQAGEGIPDLGVRQEYEQEQGGPLVARTIRYTPPKPSGPKGPQLPGFL